MKKKTDRKNTKANYALQHVRTDSRSVYVDEEHLESFMIGGPYYTETSPLIVNALLLTCIHQRRSHWRGHTSKFKLWHTAGSLKQIL